MKYVDGKIEWADESDDDEDDEEIENDEPFETATHLMPRLLVDKAVIAARQKHFHFSEELFENALDLDCTDPYVVLTAIEEYFEPREQWDEIIYYFGQLPIIDPNREFVNEARSLRQSILETIMDTEATNEQIYELYHVADNSNLDYYNMDDETDMIPDTDYYGRDVHTHSNVNDGFDRFGYNHRDFFDPNATQFEIGESKRGVESVSAAEFYAGIPNSLREEYMNLNWFEIPVMKEWLKDIPSNPSSVNWESMRDGNGVLQIPCDEVLTKEGNVKVSLEDVEKIHDLLAEEFEGVKEFSEEPKHADDVKTQSQLIREYKKSEGNEQNRWHNLMEGLEFPTDKRDFTMMPLLNESLKRFEVEEEEEEWNVCTTNKSLTMHYKLSLLLNSQNHSSISSDLQNHQQFLLSSLSIAQQYHKQSHQPQ